MQCSRRNPNPTQSVRPFLSCLVRKDQGEWREAASPGNSKKLRWRVVSGTESGPRGQRFGQLNKPREGPCSAWLPPLCHLEQITGAEATTGQPDGLSRCIKLFKASPLLLLQIKPDSTLWLKMRCLPPAPTPDPVCQFRVFEQVMPSLTFKLSYICSFSFQHSLFPPSSPA